MPDNCVEDVSFVDKIIYRLTKKNANECSGLTTISKVVSNYFYNQQNEYFVSNYEFTDRSLPMVLKPSVKTKVSVVCKCACIVDCSGLLISIPLLGIYSISQDEATLDIFQELIPLRKCEIYRQKVEKKMCVNDVGFNVLQYKKTCF